MRYQIDVLFPGFSGRLTNGRLNWGTTALLRGEGHNVMMDCGGMVVRSNLRDMLAACGLEFRNIDTVLSPKRSSSSARLNGITRTTSKIKTIPLASWRPFF